VEDLCSDNILVQIPDREAASRCAMAVQYAVERSIMRRWLALVAYTEPAQERTGSAAYLYYRDTGKDTQRVGQVATKHDGTHDKQRPVTTHDIIRELQHVRQIQ